jgi:hypothetical protein
MINRFYKDEDGWFIDLPEWPGEKADLAMVLGADTLLDKLSNGDSEIIIEFSNENFENAELLTKLHDDSEIGGAHYLWVPVLEGRIGIELELWLCDVTKFVFGSMPDKIYLKRIN